MVARNNDERDFFEILDEMAEEEIRSTIGVCDGCGKKKPLTEVVQKDVHYYCGSCLMTKAPYLVPRKEVIPEKVGNIRIN